MDRRAAFFAVAALMALLLVPATAQPLRWVPVAVSITYVVLALASLADYRSQR